MVLPDTQPVPAPSTAASPRPGPGGPASARGESPPVHPDLPPRWPAVVRTDLLRRHAELLASVDGVPSNRVLDLSLPAGRHLLAGLLAPGAHRPPVTGVDPRVGTYDAVISVAGLTRFPDLGAALESVVSLLSPAGALLAVEPDHRPGITGLAVSSLGALLPPARGVHLARDLPLTVRSVGLTITDVRRITLPTRVWPLRRFVTLRAVRIDAGVGACEVTSPGSDGAGMTDSEEDSP